MNMSQARLHLVNNILGNLTNSNIKQLKDFVAIWDKIKKEVDFRHSQYNQDRTLLSRLSFFVIENCKLKVTTPKSKESKESKETKESKENDECDKNGVVVTTKTVEETQEEKDEHEKKVHHHHVIDENEFGNLLDRLLLSISSDVRGQTNFEMERTLKEWTIDDVCENIRKYERNDLHVKCLTNIAKKRGIDGKLLFKYRESQEYMVYLLFSNIDDMKRKDTIEISQMFLDFDLRELEKITTRHTTQYDYSEIEFDNDNKSDPTSTEDTGKEIANNVLRAVQLIMLRQKMNLVIPKYETIRKILKTMKEYETMGGRQDLLNQEIKIDINESSIDGCKTLLEKWEKELKTWTKTMNDLRSRYKFLCYFTVSEMRYICDEWCKYHDKSISKQEKDKCIWRLNGKFCIVNPLFTFEQTKEFLHKNGAFDISVRHDDDGKEEQLFEELGRYLESLFGHESTETKVELPAQKQQQQRKNQEQQDFVKRGEPRVFYCPNEDKILDYMIKLYSSQGYLPQASNILFCTQNIRLEEVLCFLKRSCNYNNTLHCLITPEKLGSRVCDDLLAVLINSVNASDAIFCVISNDKTSKIYGYLSMYDMSMSLILEDLTREEFYRQCIVTDEQNYVYENMQIRGASKQFLSFLKFSFKSPFVRVYVSDDTSVGKTYEIGKLAKETNVRLIHIPCNAFNCDYEFIVNRLCSIYENCNVSDKDNEKIIFHFNISSYCSKDINVLLFKLFVLKHLSCYDENGKKGKSFAVTSNHAIFIELPCQLSHQFKETKLRNVLNFFYFVKDDSCVSHIKIINDLNRFKPSNKHIFVLKYLDALRQDFLEIQGPKFTDKDWDWKKHDIGDIVNNPQKIKS